MIELLNVSKTYKGNTALKPLSMRFNSFKTVVLIGPSGCGKSTLLRIVNGLIAPTTGQVEFDGEVFTAQNALALRRRMGYVTQDGGLFPHLTIAQNVTLLSRHLKQAQEQIQARLQELCELTQFPLERLNSYPLEISGGQAQRASLIRALMLDPYILLLDEPLGALDPMVRASLQHDLKEIFDRLNKTVIFVTHDMGEAAYLSDHIVLLKGGAVVQEGTYHDFKSNPKEQFVTDFISAQRIAV
jgi:osmoprotectant transport system ATP-binding protein